jgi:hypothetical protein
VTREACLKLHQHQRLPFPISIPYTSFFLRNTHSQLFTMDTLVATYSKPMFEKENYSQDDQVDFYNPAPSLSLKFAMPPSAQVRRLISPMTPSGAPGASGSYYWVSADDFTLTAFSLAPRCNRRPCQPELPNQDRTRHDNISIQIPRWYYRSDGLKSDGGQLDCKSNGQEGHRDQQLFIGHNGWWCCCELQSRDTASDGSSEVYRLQYESMLISY